ncbi:MAG TPA: hypothetical protein VK735_22710 [Pseudonocardia sp.]|uniref:hypothetical protein n=1 Tax=Pseudonocardia sp. TaxID=60912 RepID=UPI002C81B521|nr:hypothetical protein [Pseudonocardia sp.]HTF50259.1 hypothetical protein [Pseudonocardia sp.]
MEHGAFFDNQLLHGIWEADNGRCRANVNRVASDLLTRAQSGRQALRSWCSATGLEGEPAAELSTPRTPGHTAKNRPIQDSPRKSQLISMLAGKIPAGHGFEQTAPEAHGEIGLGRLIDELEMSCRPTDLFHGVMISIPASHHAGVPLLLKQFGG